MVRVAIVGCGRFAEHQHMRQYKNLRERVELVGFVDTKRDRAELFQEMAGMGKVYRDASELPGPEEIDYVDVCVPHHFHLPVGLALLEAGHNVLLEKPMAMSTAECDELIDAARSRGLRVGVGIHTRFYPTWVSVREFMKAGRGGRPLLASAVFNSNLESFHKGSGAREPWRGSAEGGGGALLDLGIYFADIFVWTFGDPVLVQAMRGPHSPSDPAGGQRGSEMTAVVTAELEGGVLASLRTTWDYPDAKFPAVLEGDGMTCRIMCQDGVLFAPDPASGHAAAFYAVGKEEPLLLQMPKVEGELSQVVSSIENGREFPITGVEGRRSVAFIDAALESISRRTGVKPS